MNDHLITITNHAARQAAEKGWSLDEVKEACRNPEITYPSLNHPGQIRSIRGNLVAIIDPVARVCITVYLNVERTALRPDQIPA